MKTVRLTGMMILLTLWLCFPSAGDAAKHALIIGNGDYEGVRGKNGYDALRHSSFPSPCLGTSDPEC